MKKISVGEGKRVTKGDIEGVCDGCKKVGAYNKVRAWRLKDYGLLKNRDLNEFAFCSRNCAQAFEDALWHKKGII